jgi:transcriptional regulator with GAF, ATPase, and Fis domain
MSKHLVKVQQLLGKMGQMVEEDIIFQTEVAQILKTQRNITRAINRSMSLQEMVHVIENELVQLAAFDWVSVIFYNKKFESYYAKRIYQDSGHIQLVEDFANTFFPRFDHAQLDPSPILSSVTLPANQIEIINEAFDTQMTLVVDVPLILRDSLFAHILLGSTQSESASFILLQALDSLSDIIKDAFERTPEYMDLNLWYLKQTVLHDDEHPAVLVHRGAVMGVNQKWSTLCEMEDRDFINTDFLTYITKPNNLITLAHLLFLKKSGLIKDVLLSCGDKEYRGNIEIVALGESYRYSLIRFK